MRCIFTMFAEDVGLVKEHLLTTALHLAETLGSGAHLWLVELVSPLKSRL
jgi:hypothetical protein